MSQHDHCPLLPCSWNSCVSRIRHCYFLSYQTIPGRGTRYITMQYWGFPRQNEFLEIYATAHTCSLTKENILQAFIKTGVWPFCRDVITDVMIALSKETLCESHLPVPPAPTGAIKILTDMFCKL